ncbi:hypothetical protein D3C78_270740 [compost metagenome]
MCTFFVTIPNADLAMFTRPGLDLTTGQILELAYEHPRQLDLFAPLPCGQHLSLGKILHSLGDRACHAGDQQRSKTYHVIADAVDALPSGHSLFEALEEARAAGGEQWAELEKDFVEGIGLDLPAELIGVVFVHQLEVLLDQFLAQRH